MTILEFLNILEQSDIHLTVRGDRIRIDTPAGVLTPDMLSVLTAKKSRTAGHAQDASNRIATAMEQGKDRA